MPARPLCIAMYLLELTEGASQKNTGCSAILFYGIRWAHKMAGLEAPTEHPTVIAAAGGATILDKTVGKVSTFEVFIASLPSLLLQCCAKLKWKIVDLEESYLSQFNPSNPWI